MAMHTFEINKQDVDSAESESSKELSLYFVCTV